MERFDNGRVGKKFDRFGSRLKPLLTAYHPLPPIRLYDLRHAFASNALAAGISVLVVSELLGHASAKMALDMYGHVLAGRRRTRRCDWQRT
ncbi:MAG: tyrosine-type recombinase/integrase [Gammaproteobacteria bacterium]